MSEQFGQSGVVRIDVSRDYFTFSAAHFAQHQGGASEPLHGHNYRVSVGVSGAVDELGFVVDFMALKNVLRGITAELNHRVLLPELSPRLTIERDLDQLEVAVDGARYSFPARDAAILPLVNTTCECLAALVAKRLMDSLAGLSATSLSVTVEESEGQSATWTGSD